MAFTGLKSRSQLGPALLEALGENLLPYLSQLLRGCLCLGSCLGYFAAQMRRVAPRRDADAAAGQCGCDQPQGQSPPV